MDKTHQICLNPQVYKDTKRHTHKKTPNWSPLDDDSKPFIIF